MRWFCTLVVFLCFAAPANAATPQEHFETCSYWSGIVQPVAGSTMWRRPWHNFEIALLGQRNATWQYREDPIERDTRRRITDERWTTLTPASDSTHLMLLTEDGMWVLHVDANELVGRYFADPIVFDPVIQNRVSRSEAVVEGRFGCTPDKRP